MLVVFPSCPSRLFLSSVPLLLALSACAGVSSEQSPPPPAHAVELTMSRTHLNDTDFEHYKLTDRQFFSECGSIRRGRYMPHDQNFTDLDPEVATQVMSLAAQAQEASNGQTFDPPGENRWMADPGQFVLSIEGGSVSSSIKTSLDSISGSSSPAEHRLRELAVALRNQAGETPCGNKSFFGLN